MCKSDAQLIKEEHRIPCTVQLIAPISSIKSKVESSLVRKTGLIVGGIVLFNLQTISFIWFKMHFSYLANSELCQAVKKQFI